MTYLAQSPSLVCPRYRKPGMDARGAHAEMQVIRRLATVAFNVSADQARIVFACGCEATSGVSSATSKSFVFMVIQSLSFCVAR